MNNKPSILAVIPARGGSKGVPRKNLRLFKGKTLLALAIESAKASRYINRVIVSSEDQEILDEAKRVGADVPFVRPIELAQDDTPGIEPVLHAISHCHAYDYVILLQVTSPLRTTQDIDNCIDYCLRSNAPAAVSITEPDHHPCWMFTISAEQRLIPYYSGDLPKRRQDLPLVYTANGAIYIAKTDWLKYHQTFLGESTVGFVMPKIRSIDIDTEFDLLMLEAISKYSEEYWSLEN